MGEREEALAHAKLNVSISLTVPDHWRRKEAERLMAAGRSSEALEKEIQALCSEELVRTFGGDFNDRHQVLSAFERIVARYMDLAMDMGLALSSGRSVSFVEKTGG